MKQVNKLSDFQFPNLKDNRKKIITSMVLSVSANYFILLLLSVRVFCFEL